MRTRIYKGNRKANTYLYVSGYDDFNPVPDALLKLLGKLQFVMEIELSPRRQLAQVDVADVINQLSSRGYFLQLPPADHAVEKPC